MVQACPAKLLLSPAAPSCPQVFSPTLLPLFPGGDPRATLPGPYGNTSTITSPRVVQEVRRLFDCPTAAGAPLENGGGVDSVGAHWEARLFQVGVQSCVR